MTGGIGRSGANADDDPYRIRRFEPRDLPDVADLWSSVWGRNRSEAWLTHRYEENPYLDGPSMLVAEVDDEVVAVRPVQPLPMRVASTDLEAVYLSHVMVHPDHRRRGLFSRATRRALQVYGDEASLAFLFANEYSSGGFETLGFENLGVGPTKQLLVQRPGAFVATDRSQVGRVVGGLANRAMAHYESARRVTRRIPEVSVVRRCGVPAETLAGLYEEDPPGELHTRREVQYYRWLADDPEWEYETYVARDGGEPSVGVVVQRRPACEREDRWIVDAVPPVSTDREGAYAAVLERLLEDHREAPIVSVLGPVTPERLVPRDVLAAFGFVSSRQPLVDRVVGKRNTAFVRSTGATAGDLGTVGGRDLRDPGNWLTRFR